MGFLSGSVGFTRYHIVSDIPESLWSEVPDRLERHAFRDIDDNADERSWGWTSFEDFLDTRFAGAPPQKGEFICFALRLDTRRISPAVFKKHYRLAEKDALAKAREAGRKFISREQKQEIKDRVRLSLMARTLPIPAVFEIVWNISHGRVYLNSTQTKLRDLFEDHFTQTFDLHLEMLTPYVLGADILGDEAAAALDDIEDERFS